MTDINSVSLFNQMRQMTSVAEGGSLVEKNSPASGFGDILKSALQTENNLMQEADTLRTQYELGNKNVSIADEMVASKKSELGFQATLAVRNKLVDAYQSIMNMPL